MSIVAKRSPTSATAEFLLEMFAKCRLTETTPLVTVHVCILNTSGEKVLYAAVNIAQAGTA